MSKPFLWTVIALLVAYSAFMTWLHYAEVRDFDHSHQCVKVAKWA